MKKEHFEPGQKVGELTLVREVEPHILPSGQRQRRAIFLCPYCGNEFIAQIAHVKHGHTKSCGCLKRQLTKESRTKHGLTKHPLFVVWVSMKQRCYNPKNKRYNDWGGRRIRVCDEWRNDFKAFYDWAISHGWRKGLTIDRINNDRDYMPENCRFTTHRENNRNRRSTKLTTEQAIEIRNAKLLIPDLTQKELADAYGVHRSVISDILRNVIWRI